MSTKASKRSKKKQEENTVVEVVIEQPVEQSPEDIFYDEMIQHYGKDLANFDQHPNIFMFQARNLKYLKDKQNESIISEVVEFT